MRVSLTIKKDKATTTVPLHNTFTFDERLDEELDGGAAASLNAQEDMLAEFSESVAVLDDGHTTKRVPFYAFDDVQKRAPNYYLHTLELVEPTRVLMGITCDGLKITQPVGEGTTKKTLYDTLARVLRCYNTQTSPDALYGGFSIDPNIVPMLQAVVSPEFAWQAQTLLFEVLQDIADVVDCIPRLTEDASGAFTMLTFDKVNETEHEFEI